MDGIDERFRDNLIHIQDIIDVEFKDPALLFKALVHDSFICENGARCESNERLEFLGDSVIGLVISQLIFQKYPHWSEGDMALFKSNLVSADSLATLARKIDLGSHILLGRGEEAGGGRDRTSILSDALEALVGAVYQDRGYMAARKLIKNLFGDWIDVDSPPLKDYKSKLQEISQKAYKTLPNYQIVGESGPPHQKKFQVRVNVAGSLEGEGEGSSKKEAEQHAASDLLSKMEERADRAGKKIEDMY